jgi:hypothetical protein
MVAVAAPPGVTVVTVPIANEFAGPAAPAVPGVPGVPCKPEGIPRCNVCDGDAPVMVAVAGPPGVTVVTVPIANEFGGPAAPSVPSVPSVPLVPLVPGVPGVPCNPLGMPRFSVWDGGVPVTVAVAAPPGVTVVTVPIANEFAGPVVPGVPGVPCNPLGIPRSNVCDGGVPVTVAVAAPPGATVVTVPIANEFAGPVAPSVPGNPEGIPRLNVCDGGVPVTFAVAAPPGATVVTVPIASEFAGPGAPEVPDEPRMSTAASGEVTNPSDPM